MNCYVTENVAKSTRFRFDCHMDVSYIAKAYRVANGALIAASGRLFGEIDNRR